MRPGFKVSLLAVCAGGATIAILPAARSSAIEVEEQLASPEEVHGAVRLTYEAGSDGTITGTVKNNGKAVARDVRLLVHHAWLWNNERSPGAPSDNPARSAYYVVDGEVQPGGELRFRYQPNPPLPQRTDGRFRTSAEIVGVTEAVIPE